MRALQDGRLPLGSTTVGHLDLCLGCRACEVACPSGVAYGELLESTREHIQKHYPRSLFQRFLRRIVIEGIFPSPWRMRLVLAAVGWLRKFGLVKFLPSFARAGVDLVHEHFSGDRLVEFSPATALRLGRVGFVSVC